MKLPKYAKDEPTPLRNIPDNSPTIIKKRFKEIKAMPIEAISIKWMGCPICYASPDQRCITSLTHKQRIKNGQAFFKRAVHGGALFQSEIELSLPNLKHIQKYCEKTGESIESVANQLISKVFSNNQ